MNLETIKEAVQSGKTVCWKNPSYTVIVDKLGQWFIRCVTGHMIGLTMSNGVTMNGKSEDFFIRS